MWCLLNNALNPDRHVCEGSHLQFFVESKVCDSVGSDVRDNAHEGNLNSRFQVTKQHLSYSSSRAAVTVDWAIVARALHFWLVCRELYASLHRTPITKGCFLVEIKVVLDHHASWCVADGRAFPDTSVVRSDWFVVPKKVIAGPLDRSRGSCNRLVV